MRFARIAAVAVVLGLVQLAFGWRLSVVGVAPDVLFILVAYATLTLRPTEGVPVACAVGLGADLLVGGRLGLMALGYGIGARLVDGLRPLVARWGAGHRGGVAGRALATLVLVLAGAAAAHGTVAVVGYVAGGFSQALGGRVLTGVGISFLTGLAAPVVWPILALVVGDLGGRRRAHLSVDGSGAGAAGG
jgi:cell shape-determining protein MreD